MIAFKKIWCEKCLGTGEVKENGEKWSGLGWIKGEEEETEILHLPRSNQGTCEVITSRPTEEITCSNNMSLLKELFKKWSNRSFRARRPCNKDTTRVRN